LIVLDTHAWVWWLDDPRKLPARARKAVNEAAADEAVYISTISTWEIMLLASGGRLEFRMDARDWISRSEALPFIHFVPVDNPIAIRSVRLPGSFHKDPADRIILATAMTMGAPVVSSDSRIKEYSHVKSIWK
jgi:PIN domain nuclease of toxin-antitoxin system